MICLQGFLVYQMPSTNEVWSLYLCNNGYRRRAVRNTCPDCYTVNDFCQDFPRGRYLLALKSQALPQEAIDYDKIREIISEEVNKKLNGNNKREGNK